MNFFFLKEKAHDFTPNMYGNRLPREVDGLQISLKENSRNALQYPEYANSKKVKSHYINAKYHQDAKIVNSPKNDRKLIGHLFVLRLHYRVHKSSPQNFIE